MEYDDHRAPDRTTVWPAFVVVFAAIALGVLAQLVAAVVVAILQLGGGGQPDPDAIEQATEGFFLSPVGVILMASFAEIAFLGCVWVATWRLPGPRVEQLGLRRPRLPPSSYVALVLGTGVPLACGIGLSSLLSLVLKPLIDPEQIWTRITPVTFLPYVLFIALAPGFVEELTFRGFVQRRLLRRWSPRAAIAWSSVLFAVAHVDPHHAAFALPLGVWLGVIAWRLGVIWPGIACHAALNGLWSIYFIAAVKTDLPAGFHVAAAVVVSAISVVAFVASWRILTPGDVSRTPGSGNVPL